MSKAFGVDSWKRPTELTFGNVNALAVIIEFLTAISNQRLTGAWEWWIELGVMQLDCLLLRPSR